MAEQPNTRKTQAGVAAITAAAASAAAIGTGTFAVEPHIETNIANIAEAGLAKLKATDDSAFANALRNVRDLAQTYFMGHGGFNA